MVNDYDDDGVSFVLGVVVICYMLCVTCVVYLIHEVCVYVVSLLVWGIDGAACDELCLCGSYDVMCDVMVW